MDDEKVAPDPNATFAANVRAAREARGWNQSELARRMIERGWDKYSQVSVKRTENAERAVRLDEALTLAAVLGVSLPALVGLVEDDDAGPVLALIAEAENAQDALLSAAQRLERAQERLRVLGVDAGRGLDGFSQLRLARAALPPALYLQRATEEGDAWARGEDADRGDD